METGDDCERLTANTARTIMNARLFIITASIVSFAQAHPFPATPELDDVVAVAIQERKAKAPHYAEGQVTAPVTAQRIPIVQSMGQAEVAMRQFSAHPVPASAKAAPSRVLPRIDHNTRDMGAIPQSKHLPLITPMSFNPFLIKLEFIWEKPHGQWMNQLLKDINAAKVAGDIETYNALTARYAAWAEKYLRSAEPPNLDGKPGR